MTSILGLGFVLATIALAPCFLLMAAITVGAVLPKRRRPSAGAGSSRFVVVIPAHDEEGVIASTVRSCLALDYDRARFRVRVIADNCTDRTAEVALASGAEVVERSDPDLRSKGHALRYFFEQVADARPDSGTYDAAVLVDADTVVDPGLLRAFDRDLEAGWDWVQGYYTVRNPDASWRTRMLTLAFGLANGSWPLGLDRLGLGVGLKGNGMCFSSRGLRRHPWEAHGLVEDMEFALTLRAAGERVRFDPDARVLGEMVSRGGPGAASQRRRWEEGRKALRGRFFGPLTRSARLGPPAKLAYLIDLFFPPLATLALALALLVAVHPLVSASPGLAPTSALVVPAHLLMAVTLVAYAVSPVVAVGLPARYLLSVAALPYYVAWKLAITLGKRSRGWIRTPREPGTSD